MMVLRKFKVVNFRSVAETDWIETEDVTALIGTNEAGKTNLLLPLWKLSPAKEGEIKHTADYPRKRFNDFRKAHPQPTFIRAVFDVGGELADRLASMTHLPVEAMRRVEVSRSFDGEYEVDFPEATPPRSMKSATVIAVLDAAAREIGAMNPLKSEDELRERLAGALGKGLDALRGQEEATEEQVTRLLAGLEEVKTEGAPKTSSIVPRYRQAVENLGQLRDQLTLPRPADVEGVFELVVENLPKFVYYSTYGNLDSEIYLPHVIENLKRTDLGVREQAKARTLKVLFEFVRLQPQEILELGLDFKDPKNPARKPTDEEISAIAEKKKQRSILLQSASALLTTQFRDWWKQGEYRFRFEADGDHFRIWVSDDRRPEEIELEGRSTGLQWFLSFYLVFLVERVDAHKGAILLLDEPGLSLHPLAQRDLSEFFNGLAENNQLIYTCHSPFLVDADRLDRARKVYTGADGTSKVTSDLREREADSLQRGAAYAVHAALGLSVAESLLIGCSPIVVEGPSDQHYLTAMKTLLIAAGRLSPGRELVFPPAGGAKGVRAVTAILSSRDEELPVALFDSDAMGRETVASLRKGLYAGAAELLLDVDPFTGMADSEVEDLLDPALLVLQFDRWQRGAPVPFGDEVKPGQPIIPQIETWAARHAVKLEKPGWKVELAKRVKKQLLTDGFSAVPKEILERWERLFLAFRDVRTKIDEEGKA